MTKFTQFDDASIRKIAEAVRRLGNTPWNRPARPGRERDAPYREILNGKTTTNYRYITYPDDGDTFLVQIEDALFQEIPGDQDVTYDLHNKRYIVARTFDGSYIDEDTHVLLVRLHTHRGGRRWWIIPQGSHNAFRVKWSTTTDSSNYWDEITSADEKYGPTHKYFDWDASAKTLTCNTKGFYLVHAIYDANWDISGTYHTPSQETSAAGTLVGWRGAVPWAGIADNWTTVWFHYNVRYKTNQTISGGSSYIIECEKNDRIDAYVTYSGDTSEDMEHRMWVTFGDKVG